MLDLLSGPVGTWRSVPELQAAGSGLTKPSYVYDLLDVLAARGARLEIEKGSQGGRYQQPGRARLLEPFSPGGRL
jgi:hypothetical protein